MQIYTTIMQILGVFFQFLQLGTIKPLQKRRVQQDNMMENVEDDIYVRFMY